MGPDFDADRLRTLAMSSIAAVDVYERHSLDGDRGAAASALSEAKQFIRQLAAILPDYLPPWGARKIWWEPDADILFAFEGEASPAISPVRTMLRKIEASTAT